MATTNSKQYVKDELQTIIKKCNSKTEFAREIGYIYYNGRVAKIINKLIIENDLDCNHFDSSLQYEIRRKYNKVDKICPVCSKQFVDLSGSPKEKTTCSISCSNTYFSASKHTEASNLKRSLKLKSNYKFKQPDEQSKSHKQPKQPKYCKHCSFLLLEKQREFCSNSCASKFRSQNPEYRKKLSDLAKQRVANGTHKGWTTRSKIKPSYAELYIAKLLNELEIKFKPEHPAGRWFIDFADIDRKLALEVDGKQHNLPERKLSDLRKDQYLIDDGWIVKRIKWKKITKEFRDFLISELKDFFK